MPIDLGTNLNVASSLNLDELKQSEATQKTTRALHQNAGITDISEAENILLSFSSPIKPTLTAPTVSLTDMDPLELDTHAAQLLNLGTNPTYPEFVRACLDKLQATGITPSSQSGKNTLEEAAIQFDNEAMECFCLLLTMGTKSKLVQTLKEALLDKTKTRQATNDKYLKELSEVSQKNVEAKNKQIAAEKKRKRWGIFGAIFGAIVAVVTAVTSVITCGATSAFGIMAIAGAVACVASSTLEIITATHPELKAKLGIASLVIGLIGLALTVTSAVGAYKAAAKAATEGAAKTAVEAANAPIEMVAMDAAHIGKAATVAEKIADTSVKSISKWQAFKNFFSSIFKVKAGAQEVSTLQTLNAVFSTIGGVSTGSTHIVNSAYDKQLAELEKNLANSKITLKKIDQDITILSKFIEKVSNELQTFIKDILSNEEKAAQLINEMMNTALSMDRQIGC